MNFRQLLKWLLFGFIFCLIYYWSCSYYPGLFGYHEFHYTQEKYKIELNNINTQRINLKEEYLISKNKSKTLQKASVVFQDQIDLNLFPYWFGTDYDFYGTTLKPGKGEIACGYFVTTLLQDMGFKLDRVGLAKMASEKMIQSLIQEKHIKRYSNKNLSTVLKDINYNGKGIYIIGLDTHTGFLIHDGDDIYFIHASGRYPWQVIEEIAEESEVLHQSLYRVTGQLNKDDRFIKNWLFND